jgi:trimeric autotransporter adhesin
MKAAANIIDSLVMPARVLLGGFLMASLIACGNTSVGSTADDSDDSPPPGSGPSCGSSSRGGADGLEGVVWTDLVNATVCGTTLKKTGGCDGCLDSGAASRQRLSVEDSYLEFPVLENQLVRYIGLNTFSTTVYPTDILFSLKFVSGFVDVKEAGELRAEIPVAIGDVLRISVKSGVVSYAKNGTVFYVSEGTEAMTAPSLQVDTSFINSGSTITDARVFGVLKDSAGSAASSSSGPAGSQGSSSSSNSSSSNSGSSGNSSSSSGSSSNSSSNSSSGSGSGGGALGRPPAPRLEFAAVQTKTFRFTWTDVAGETGYRLLEDADGASGYARVATIPANSVDHNHQVFLPGRINARYILQACNGAGCADSDPVPVNGAIGGAVGYVKASNTGAGDGFGYAVAVSGDGKTLAVGAPFEDSAAAGVNGDQNDNSARDIDAVYVFIRNRAGNWIQQAYLKAADLPGRRLSGFGAQSLALSHDGNTLALGVPRDPSSVIPTPANGWTYNDTGSVYVFTRSRGNWSQQAYLKNPDVHREDSDAADGFGAAVALSSDGNTLAVGSPGQNAAGGGYDHGGVYVYVRSRGGWTEQARVTSANGFVYAAFGKSIALSGDGNTLAVGAPGERRSGSGINNIRNSEPFYIASGAAYVFRHTAGMWTEQAYIKASDTRAFAGFGTSVALSNNGGLLAVGAPGDVVSHPDNQTDGGTVYVFSRSGANWAERDRIRATLPARGDYFGKFLALSADGATLGIGMPRTAEHSGAVHVFKSDAGNWQQRAYLEPPNGEAGDAFGEAVALSGNADILAVGARLEDSAATGVNGDQDDNSAPDSGAVYLY